MKRSVMNPKHFRVGDILETYNRGVSFIITRIDSDGIWFANIERPSEASCDTYEAIRGGAWRNYEFKKQFNDYYDKIKDTKTTS